MYTNVFFYVYSGMHYEMLVTMKLFLWGVLLLQVSLTATSESQVSHSFSTQYRKIRDRTLVFSYIRVNKLRSTMKL